MPIRQIYQKTGLSGDYLNQFTAPVNYALGGDSSRMADALTSCPIRDYHYGDMPASSSNPRFTFLRPIAQHINLLTRNRTLTPQIFLELYSLVYELVHGKPDPLLKRKGFDLSQNLYIPNFFVY